MIAPVDKPTRTLIKQHKVDTDKGLVELVIPNAGEALTASILNEIAAIKAHNQYPADISLRRDDTGTATIAIQSNDVALLAMNVTNIMTRRVQVCDAHSRGEEVHYASADDTQSVLQTLKSHAQKTSPNAALAIDSLMSTARRIAQL